MTAGIVALYLIGPWLLVPLGLRLIDPSSDPSATALARTASRGALAAAALLTVAFLLPAGPLAGVLATPWLVVVGVVAIGAIVSFASEPARLRLRPSPMRAMDIARGFLVISATFAMFDRLGVRPLDFTATIILLTAVHFQFAGFILVLVGSLVWRARSRPWVGAALAAIVAGIPLTALGFFGLPAVAWIGVVLVAIGALGVAVASIAGAGRMTSLASRRLSIVSGSALFISMPMAVVYSTGLMLGIGWLDIPAMAGIHGTINALAFAAPAVAAWTLEHRSRP